MTDFFADLEHELRRAHRRETAGRRIAVPNLRPLLAAAAIAAVMIAIVTTLAREQDAERAASPPPAATEGGWTPYAPLDCDPYEPPIVNATRPKEILDRFAIFRSGKEVALPDIPGLFGAQAKRLYAEAVRIHAPSAYGPGPATGVAIIADVIPRSAVPMDRDPCEPPAGDTEPGVCVATDRDEDALSACFTVDEILNAQAYIAIGRRAVFGLAPDGVKRVILDAGQPIGPQRLEVAENGFGDSQLYLYPATSLDQVDIRFEP